WIVSEGEDRYRRGLYTFLRRTSPYPAFMTFDATSRESCIVRRVRTNTPLQALTLLNDEAFFDAARALARRMLTGGRDDFQFSSMPSSEALQKLKIHPDPPDLAAYGVRLVLSRQPDPRELERLLAGYAEHLAQFQ